MQRLLFGAPAPPTPTSIDLRCCDVADLLTEVRGASLVFADPPWDLYHQKPGKAHPEENAYQCLTLREIKAHLTAAADSAAAGSRLVFWYTWPLEPEIVAADVPGKPWAYKTGGSWCKVDAHGPGYHWAGNDEPVRIYTKKGTPYRDTSIPLRSGFSSKPEGHSAKPVGWQADMIRRWTRPGDLVLDLYAGSGSVAIACVDTGRRYVGAEIDPTRHAAALGRLADHVSRGAR